MSRVGGNAQNKAMKKVAGSLRLDLAQYRELAAFTKFGSELDKSTQAQLNRGERLIEILKQPQYQPYPTDQQVVILYVAGQGFIDEVPVPRIKDFERGFLKFIGEKYPQVCEKLRATKELTSEVTEGLKKAVAEYKQDFK